MTSIDTIRLIADTGKAWTNMPIPSLADDDVRAAREAIEDDIRDSQRNIPLYVIAESPDRLRGERAVAKALDELAGETWHAIVRNAQTLRGDLDGATSINDLTDPAALARLRMFEEDRRTLAVLLAR